MGKAVASSRSLRARAGFLSQGGGFDQAGVEGGLPHRPQAEIGLFAQFLLGGGPLFDLLVLLVQFVGGLLDGLFLRGNLVRLPQRDQTLLLGRALLPQGVVILPGERAESDRRHDQDRRQECGHARSAPDPERESFDPTERTSDNRLLGQPALQVGRQVVRGAVTLSRRLVQALQADRLQVARHQGVQIARRVGLTLHHLDQRLEGVGRAKGWATYDQFVEDGAQPVNVGGNGQILSTGRLLRGHVTGRSHQAGLSLVCALYAASQAEVGEVGLAVFIENDVRRLEIAVQESPLMGVVDRSRGL
jgi:hypothetical protein